MIKRKKLQGKAVRVWAWEVKRQVGILRGKMHSLAWPVHAWHVGAVTPQSGCKAHLYDAHATVLPCKSFLIHTHFAKCGSNKWPQITTPHKSLKSQVPRRKLWAINHKRDGREVGWIWYLAKRDNMEGHSCRQWTRGEMYIFWSTKIGGHFCRQWTGGDQNPIWLPQKRTLPSSTVGEVGDDAENFDICKIISKLTLEYNFIVHLIVLHLLTVGQHGTNLIDWWHSCSKYNLAL